jgi:hypothetical protein
MEMPHHASVVVGDIRNTTMVTFGRRVGEQFNDGEMTSVPCAASTAPLFAGRPARPSDPSLPTSPVRDPDADPRATNAGRMPSRNMMRHASGPIARRTAR